MSTEGGSNQSAAARSRGDLAQLRRLARFLIPYRQQLLLAMLALALSTDSWLREPRVTEVS